MSRALLERLGRFHVVLWDDQGFRHMVRNADGLREVGSAPRWVCWDDAPPKGDAADAPVDEVARLVREAVPATPEFLSAQAPVPRAQSNDTVEEDF